MPNERITKFVELHKETETLLSQDKISDAKQKYLDVVNAYHDIEQSSLEQFHKELAHEQVTSLFKKVNDAKERVQIPYNLIVAAVLLIAFSFLVFLRPSIIGFAGLDDVLRTPINITFTESGLHAVTLADRPLSILASGSFNGPVKLYYKRGEKLELIMDSNKIDGNTFTDVCLETCDVIADSNTIELFAQIETGSSLTLSEIAYKTKRETNTAPVWIGSTRIFRAALDQPMRLDLSQYFTDSEKDPLVFLSTTEKGLDVLVQNNFVTITPRETGSKNIVLIASDLRDVTRVPVTVEVN